MRSYAEGTMVSVEKSRGEIEALVSKAGADAFASASKKGEAMIQFQLGGRVIRFRLPLPDRENAQFALTPGGRRRRDEAGKYQAWEQSCREKWRALYLSIKAKLYSIETGIETFDSAFMAHIVMPNGRTMEELAVPLIEHAYECGKMPDMNVLALTN